MSAAERKIKIKPYPFPATIEHAGAQVRCEIVKLTMIGFMVNVKNHVFTVGGDVILKMDLPVNHGEVTCTCRTIKIYNVLKSAGEGQRTNLVEFHFLRPKEVILNRIHKFLMDIRQRNL